MSRACYALDVGGTKIAAALIDAGGAVLAEHRRPTEAAGGGVHVVRNMIAAIEALAPGVGSYHIAGIGISAAGVIDTRAMRVLDATDAMPGWAGTDFGVLLGGRFALPVAAANDVHCALLGELARNPLLAGMRGTVAMLAVGTGLGGAVAVDGRLAAGRHGLAGHFGRSLGRDPLDGSVASFDALASGSALGRFYRRLAPARPACDGAAILDLAAAGEPEARAAVDAWLDSLALLLHNLYWSLDPELVLLGGGVLDSRALWWDDLLARLRAHGAKPALAPASLGNAAALHGAAHLVLGGA